jgi:hypothetical protein
LSLYSHFIAALLEGLEVVFIVIALSAGRGTLIGASAGALAACLLGLCPASAPGAGSGKHTQVRRRHNVVRIRRVLDW